MAALKGLAVEIFDGVQLPTVNWKFILELITATGFLLAAIAAVIAVFRLKSIREAFAEYQRSRNDLSEIIGSIERLESLRGEFQNFVSDISEEAEVIQSIEKRLADRGAPIAVQDVQADEHWQTVRQAWRRARDKIERVVDNLDGRVRRPYHRIKRNSYEELITKLRDDGHLNPERAGAALQMNGRFLQLRPRPSNTTEHDAQNFEQWEAQV